MSLKSKATKGMFWNAVEKLSVQAGRFIVGIILARILIPEDFGLIGMLAIFIAISQTFIESGLGSGLIQKLDRTDIDYSTVFVFNFFISAVLYSILFISAPYIADFYNEPQLVLLTRVLMVSLILNSLIIVQRTILIIELDFRAIAKTNVVSVVIGGFMGIYTAYNDYGVWALVIQSLTRIFVTVIMFWWLSKWKFSIAFSKESFKSLFSFGSKLLISGIYSQVMNNIYNVFIGKYYFASDLGYYNRAKDFTELSSGTITSVLQQVTFPVLASLQNEKERLISVYRRLIKMSAFFIFPAMMILSVLADPIVRVLLGEKWLFVIPLLHWMPFTRIFYPISSLNMNILNATGRSDLFLKVDLSKFPVIVGVMIYTIPMGVMEMIVGQVFVSFIAFLINAYLPGKLYGYGILSQLKDMLFIILATVLSAVTIYISLFYIKEVTFKLIFGLLIGGSSYLFFSFIFKIEEIHELLKLIGYKKRVFK